MQTSHARNLAIKLPDGDPIFRKDLQHSLLAHILNDTTRCFTNPRPRLQVVIGEATKWSSADTAMVPVHPAGQAEGTFRRSEETPEERQAWEERMQKWKTVQARREKRALLEKAKQDEQGEKEQEGEAAKPLSDEAKQAIEEQKKALPDAEEIKQLEQHEEEDAKWPTDGMELLTFKELYLESLITSVKCSKSVRHNLVTDHIYSEALLKLCLLLNAGRLNTTLAFYPEMKTQLRSYHPIPSLQTTDTTRRNLQDTPRLKALLKGQLLSSERPAAPAGGPPMSAATLQATRDQAEAGLREPPTTLDELMAGRWEKHKMRPPTSIISIIFVLASHAEELTDLHFDPPYDAWSVFFPDSKHPVPFAADRARIFLWLIWHYVEGGAALPPGSHGPNPFGDEESEKSVQEARKTWDSMSAEAQEKLRTEHGRWRGVRNSEYYERSKAADETDGASVTQAASGASTPKFLHCIKAPRFRSAPPELIAKEDIDSRQELDFAELMRFQRAEFISKLADDARATADGDASDDHASIGFDQAGSSKKGKKRKGSSLTATLALKKGKGKAAATAATLVPDDSGAPAVKSPTLKISPSSPGKAESELAVGAGTEEVDESRLFPADLLERLASKELIPTSLAKPGKDSMARQAWRRILERAAQGIGDASYDSDQEEQANYEARDERLHPKLEMARMLHCIRNSRTLTTLKKQQNA